MTVAIAAQNTSSQKFVLHSIAADLYCNNYLVGNLSSFTQQAILPNAQTLLFFDIRLSMLAIVQDIISAFQDQNTTQNLLLKGYVNVDNYNIPLSIPYKVGL
jgi:LEA14-like dessication related protein